MNVRRITSASALALALVATVSPAWSADGNQSAGGGNRAASGIAWAGGTSGIASQLAREYARHPQPNTGALSSPRAAYSWDHDSRIPTQLTPPAGTSWDHDSRIPTQRSPRDPSWSHDSHWADGTSATSLRRTSPAR